jgi:hypothetical protein
MRNAMDMMKTEHRSTRVRSKTQNKAQMKRRSTRAQMNASGNANTTQEHMGSNKCKKTRDAIKRNNKGRDDLETN